MKKFLPSPKGFTLIELMVVVTIIAFLSVIGIVAFGNAQKQARDGRRRGDVDAIAIALEANRNQLTGAYPVVTNSMFAKNVIPAEFVLGKTPYTRTYYKADGTTSCTPDPSANPPVNCPKFVVCANLEINTGNSSSSIAIVAPTKANEGDFYCRGSQQ